MGAALSPGPGLARATAVLASAGVLALAAAASLIPALLSDPACSGDTSATAPPSATAAHEIPADYLTLYRNAGAAYAVPWPILAAIGAIESDHGRSHAPGVQSGVNAFGCCAGPMQFNIRNGPPSTWQTYRVDGNADGVLDPYDPADAIASAARYVHALLATSHGNVGAAIYGYNHSGAYVADVLARAGAYAAHPAADSAAPTAAELQAGACAGAIGATGGARLSESERRTEPRAYAMLPAWAMAGGRPTEPIDARLLDNALWIPRTYHLRVTAAREAGHNTHGDGTALDLVPAEPVDQAAWDASTGALAHDLGWTPQCAAAGSRPVCPLCPRSSSSAMTATPTTAPRAPVP